ncbi:MAG: flagellar basal-body MS-ring/collar protein FliF [Planctomycetaceae bacterium]
MNLFQSLRSHAVTLWQGWNTPQRTAVLGGMVFCVALVAGVGWWVSRPELVTLASQLAPADSAEIISALEAANIEYQLNFAGSAVLVPRSTLSQARLAIKDVAIAGSINEDDNVGSGLWADPTVTQVRLLRDQEARLARSIMQMQSVRGATVHLTQPDSSPFVRDRAIAKASVVLDLRPGVPFGMADAYGIASLVAHSVEGLDPEQVTVLDTTGRHLSDGTRADGDITGRLDYQRNLESELAIKAEAMLAQLLGPGAAVVRVTADIDFTELRREETTYDPESKVKLTEWTRSETTTEPARGGRGRVAGAGSNLGSVSGDPNAPASSSKSEENETTYENARVVDTLTERPGTIKRLTVAAVVRQLPPTTDADEPAAATPALDQQAIAGIIKQAVGFDESRGDGIEVLLTTTPPNNLPDALPAASRWAEYEGVISAASLGIAAIVALVVGVLLMRRLRPVVVEVAARDGLSIDDAERLAELTRKAREQPEASAKLIAAWLREADEPRSRQAAA